MQFSSIQITDLRNFSRKVKWSRMSTMKMIHYYLMCELVHEYDNKYVISSKLFIITVLIYFYIGKKIIQKYL